MNTEKTSPFPSRVVPLVPPVLAAILVFVGIGGFGIWEPAELSRLELGGRLNSASACPGPDRDGDCIPDAKDKCPMEAETRNGVADRDGCPDDPPGTGVLIEERVSARLWKAMGMSEGWARLPAALLALIAIAAAQLTLSFLAGRRIGFIAALVMAGSPVLLLNGRQVTGHGLLLCGETLAMCGLLLAARAQGKRAIPIGWATALAGMVLATLDAGLLAGVALPCGAVFLAEVLATGPSRLFSRDGSVPRSRRLAVIVCGLSFAIAAVSFSLVAFASDRDLALVTGGLAQSPPKDWNATVTLQKLAYGWFPWSALLPLLLLGLPAADGEADGKRPWKLFALCAIVLALAIGTITHALRGDQPLFLAMPVAFAVALVLAEMEEAGGAPRFAGLIVLLLLAVMIRDFAQRPAAILAGHALSITKPPDSFNPVPWSALFCAPFAVMVALGAMIRGGSGWRAARIRAALPFAAAAVGGCFTLVLVPSLSLNLSSRHVLESYDRYATASEPLGILGGAGDLPAEATALENRQAALDWLARDDKVFALVPPSQLAELDREHRARSGDHVFVLDATSQKFVLATNRPQDGQENQNPIVRFVRSSPFEPGPRNEKLVNFDDRLTLLGWEITSASGKAMLERGKEFKLVTYWRCEQELDRDWEIFVHIDGPGPRIHGDHAPVEGTFPTRHWSPGDHIRDEYTGSVPAYQEKGKYGVNIGMYKGDTRLSVIEPKVKEDSVRLGHVTLE